MKSKRVIKAVLVMVCVFFLVMISLILLNPDSSLHKFVFQIPKDEVVESAYDVKDNSKVSGTSSKNKTSSKEEKSSDEDVYANQILDKDDSGVNNEIYCQHCHGSGEMSCLACYGSGIMTDGSVCLICYGDGKVPCDKCGKDVIIK